MTDKYSAREWAFIKTFEEQAPAMSEFLFRLRQHEAKRDEPDFGMTADDIQRCEDIMREGCPDSKHTFTPEQAWDFINQNLHSEELDIVQLTGLRTRAEAAWKEYQATQSLQSLAPSA